MFEHAFEATLLLHLVALGSMLPERVMNSEDLSRTLVALAATLRDRLALLFVRMPPTIAAEDLEEVQTRRRLIDLLQRMVTADAVERAAEPPPSGVVRIVGEVDCDRLEALIPEVAAAPLGCVIPWIACAELLGTAIEFDGTRSAVLAPYRELLLERFAVLADQSPQIFWRRLAAEKDRELDERLAAVIGALRGAASLAAV